MNTSLDSTRPSTPVTSRTDSTWRRSTPPVSYSFTFLTKTTKLIEPAISMWVASTGRFSSACRA